MASTNAHVRQEEFLRRVLPTFGDESVSPTRQAGHPCHFLDTHLDEGLLLKRVKALPLLAADLAKAVDTCLSTFPSPEGLRDRHFLLAKNAYGNATDVSTAPKVALLRAVWLEKIATRVSCSVLMYPDEPDNSSALLWASGSGHVDTVDESTSDDFLVQDQFLCMAKYRNVMDELELFSPDNQKKLLALEEFQQYWAAGMFFCPSADWLLRDMDALLEEESFPWWKNSLPSGEPPLALAQPRRDSSRTLWSLPDVETISQVRNIRRSARQLDTPPTRFCPPGPILTILPEHDSWRDKPERYMQRAWMNAVRTNASVILFDCGNFFRIGVRHRASQTLYLSPIINPREVGHDSVPYGRLLLGMYFGIVSDALDRYEAESSTPPKTISANNARKRTSQRHTISPVSQRNPALRRGQNMTIKQLESLDKLFTRPVVALYLRFDIYNSPSPSVLFKPGAMRQQRYSTREYLTISIAKRLGHGATGDVYQVVLVGRPFPTLILKLATTRERLGRLRHEYMIYEHLRTTHIVGIPKVFGFFQDGDRSVGALIMSDVGSPLVKSPIDDAVKHRLRETLKSLHAAGVLHRDLRSWNILVDVKEQPSIIDFDRARLTATSMEFDIERDRLERFLRGDDVNAEVPIGREGMVANMEELIMDNY